MFLEKALSRWLKQFFSGKFSCGQHNVSILLFHNLLKLPSDNFFYWHIDYPLQSKYAEGYT